MSKKPKIVTAIELQDKKCKAEIKIMKILQNFNDLCVANHFQLEGIGTTISNTDADRTFDVDLLIV